MSLNKTSVENQIMGGIAIIMQSIRDKTSDLYKEACAYSNMEIPNLYMVISKYTIHEPGLIGYFSIGFQTPNHKHVTDVMEVAYTTSGTFYRFQGVSIRIACTETMEVMSTQEQMNWMKIIVQSNTELLAVLEANEEFNNGNKKNSK
ncbi:hypothetical protein N1M2_24 [Klebsiella phage N1M2]|uniref:Uncharacterized protein n=1 Tax=Klebsiella phage N1M2 TaxID=2664939 RepID=A0A6B7ZEG9_9CAUD|nr:hypothetical protein PQB72_gp024 [Klebsiella phage N1M2]QGH71887.1 hypothetical protein N1M2_24 [Klebsiella phage N1M2]